MKYLHALHDEFSNILLELERVMRLNNRNADLAHELSLYTGPQDPDLTAGEFDSLLMCINTEVQYRPGTGVLDDIISSGKLDLISNDQLRYEITSWESVMQFVRFQELEHAKTRSNLVDMMSTEGNLRMGILNALGELYGLTESRFPDTNLVFLESLEFDNNLIAFFITAKFLNLLYYSRLKERIEKVLSIIEDELKL